MANDDPRLRRAYTFGLFVWPIFVVPVLAIGWVFDGDVPSWGYLVLGVLLVALLLAVRPWYRRFVDRTPPTSHRT